MVKAGSNPAPSTVQWKTESHLPLWGCEGPEAVKVKSVSSGACWCPFTLLLFWIMGGSRGIDRQKAL